jgi:hypothetical protein
VCQDFDLPSNPHCNVCQKNNNNNNIFILEFKLFFCSTLGLDVVKKVTRSYLEKSASIPQGIHELNTPKTQANSSKVNSKSGQLCCLWVDEKKEVLLHYLFGFI